MQKKLSNSSLMVKEFSFDVTQEKKTTERIKDGLEKKIDGVLDSISKAI